MISELVGPFLEAGSAGLVAISLYLTMRLVLGYAAKQSRAERQDHREIVERLLATHQAGIERIVGAIERQGEVLHDLDAHVRAQPRLRQEQNEAASG